MSSRPAPDSEVEYVHCLAIGASGSGKKQLVSAMLASRDLDSGYDGLDGPPQYANGTDLYAYNMVGRLSCGGGGSNLQFIDAPEWPSSEKLDDLMEEVYSMYEIGEIDAVLAFTPLEEMFGLKFEQVMYGVRRLVGRSLIRNHSSDEEENVLHGGVILVGTTAENSDGGARATFRREAMLQFGLKTAIVECDRSGNLQLDDLRSAICTLPMFEPDKETGVKRGRASLSLLDAEPAEDVGCLRPMPESSNHAPECVLCCRAPAEAELISSRCTSSRSVRLDVTFGEGLGEEGLGGEPPTALRLPAAVVLDREPFLANVKQYVPDACVEVEVSKATARVAITSQAGIPESLCSWLTRLRPDDISLLLSIRDVKAVSRPRLDAPVGFSVCTACLPLLKRCPVCREIRGLCEMHWRKGEDGEEATRGGEAREIRSLGPRECRSEGFEWVEGQGDGQDGRCRGEWSTRRCVLILPVRSHSRAARTYPLDSPP